jgi:hypothetical protein
VNAADREQLQLCLVRWLYPRNFGAPVDLLRTTAVSEGLRVSEDEITAELEYLADATNALGKRLVESPAKLNPARPIWRLTAAGREFAQERGLA